MPNGLMSIGMFSRSSLLSIKALRAYHAAGILVPAPIDPATGYRAYLASQLTDAAVLRRLRDLDLPLSDVGASLTPVHIREEPAIQTVECRGRVREAAFATFLDTRTQRCTRCWAGCPHPSRRLRLDRR